MRFLPAAVFLALTALSLDGRGVNLVALAKKPNRPPNTSSRAARATGRPAATSSSSSRRAAPPPASRRRPVYEEEDEDDDDEDEFLEVEEIDILEVEEEDDDDLFDDEDDDDEPIIDTRRPPPKSRRTNSRTSGRAPPPSRSSAGGSRTAAASSRTASTASRSRKRPPPPSRSSRNSRYDDYYDDEDVDDYVPPPRRSSAAAAGRGRRGPPPPRGGPRPSGRGGRVVPYTKPGAGANAAATFTRGLAAIRNAMPDPNTVKDAALSGLNAARETTSHLSSNIYREVKGLTSSELEQVLLKATRPDDTAVKGKHVERLVGVTYQISPRYDIYDAVLRKLWSKMAEKDWRTTMKALYILHRFSADGAPEHAPALKARLRELRRTRDPKRKDKYFNSKQLLGEDNNPANSKFRAFMSRYAHYVLLRAQCFSGVFSEIADAPKPDKKKKSAAPNKPITSTSLSEVHLSAAEMILKAGVVCQLKPGEECENTAIASERVASDMIGLTTAVAIALNRALKDDSTLKSSSGADPALLKKWCVFYSEELLPQTKAMVKKISPKLDAYGLFLPSRMGASLSPTLLEKGLHLEEEAEDDEDEEEEAKSEPATAETESVVDVSEEVDDSSASAAADTARSKAKAEARKQRAAEPVVEEDDESEAQEEGDEAIEEEPEFDDEYEYEEEEYYDDEE